MHWLRALWKTRLKRCSFSFRLQYSRMSDRKVYQPMPWAVIFWTKREQLASSKTWSINWRSLDSVDWNTFAALDGINQPLRRVRLTRVFCSCGLSLLKQTSRQTFIFSSSGTTAVFCKCSKLSSGGEELRCSKRLTRSSCEDIIPGGPCNSMHLHSRVGSRHLKILWYSRSRLTKCGTVWGR